MAKSFSGLIPKKGSAPSNGVLRGMSKTRVTSTSGNNKRAPTGILAYAMGKKPSEAKAKAVAAYVKRENS